MTVYVLEFDRPLGNPAVKRGTARYYVGYCESGRLHARLEEHRAGNGAAITRAAVAAGIAFTVVFAIDGGRDVERALKRQKNTPKIVERYRRTGIVWSPPEIKGK